MNILQLSPHDHQGGASRIAWYLFDGFKQRGLQSMLAVGKKSLNEEGIIEIDQAKYQRLPLLWKLGKWTHILLGWENFNYPATPHIPHLGPIRPDIIHAHNLQGKYFDLRLLPQLSTQFPMVLTLHDTWLLSGHCAYAVHCERWRTGCGKCPDLNAQPAVRSDSTAFNWRRKKRIYQDSVLYIATPSQWLMDQVHHSMLMPAIRKAKVIHNGVDTRVYRPLDKQKIRHALGLPKDAFVLLYVVASKQTKSSYKDFPTIEQALNLLQQRVPVDRKIIFIGLGKSSGSETLGNLEKRFMPYLTDTQQLAMYYQAADVMLHAARADNLPNVVLEALACGTCVVATAVGGIPEEIIDGKTGFLTPAGDPETMCQKVLELLMDDQKRETMSAAAVEDVMRRFLIPRMIDEYLSFYEEAASDFAGSGVRKDYEQI